MFYQICVSFHVHCLSLIVCFLSVCFLVVVCNGVLCEWELFLCACVSIARRWVDKIVGAIVESGGGVYAPPTLNPGSLLRQRKRWRDAPHYHNTLHVFDIADNATSHTTN